MDIIPHRSWFYPVNIGYDRIRVVVIARKARDTM